MPYTEHREFQPPTKDVIVWRYFDMLKFMNFIIHSALYLCRADLLGDPYEGTLSRANLNFENTPFESMPTAYASTFPTAEKWAEFLQQLRRMREINREVTRSFAYISCWHMSPYESAAMWATYAREGTGIAIRTTFGRLVQSLRPPPDVHIHAGLVNYIDWSTHPVPIGNAFAPLVFKRASFAADAEVRLIHIGRLDTREAHDLLTGKTTDLSALATGLSVSVDMDVLAPTVFLAPQSPAWVLDTVNSLLTCVRPGLVAVQSDLASSRLY